MDNLPLYPPGEKILIITHRRADIDALASAVLMLDLVDRLGWKRKTFVIPEGISTATLQTLDRIGLEIKYYREIPDETYDLAIVLDTASEKLLGSEWSYIKVEKVLWIDHHISQTNRDYYLYVDDKASSTAELVLDIYSLYYPPNSIDKKKLLLTAVSIIVETRFLQLASARALLWMARILESTGTSMNELFRYVVRPERDRSEDIALAKAVVRSWGWKVDNYMVVATFSSSHHNKISKGLLNMGFDIAIVASYKKRGKIHLRCREAAVKLQGLIIDWALKGLNNMGVEVAHGGHKTIYNIEFSKIEKDILKQLIDKAVREASREMGYSVNEIT